MEWFYYLLLNRTLRKYINPQLNSRAGFDEFYRNSLAFYETHRGDNAYLNIEAYNKIVDLSQELDLKFDVGTFEYWHDPEDNPMSSSGGTPGIMFAVNPLLKVKGLACPEGVFYPLYVTEPPVHIKQV